MYGKFKLIASLNTFLLKKKKISIELWSVWFVFLYRDVDKYGHADISFLTKIYQFIKIKQNVHYR